MKILVLSDSHGSLKFMRQCIDTLHPDYLLHLGDYYEDAEMIHQEYPELPMKSVPGNCDAFRCPVFAREILTPRIDGVDIYMTHGHLHSVKSTLGPLVRDALAAKADIVVYGHTHIPDCHREQGIWVLNPGTCGYLSSSAGLIETCDGKITSCRNLWQEDLEDFV